MVSQPELELCLALSNVVYPGEICHHTLNALGQYKPFTAEKIRVDFFLPSRKIIFEMLGCFYHMMDTCLNFEKVKKKLDSSTDAKEKCWETLDRIQNLTGHFDVKTVQECHWNELVQSGGSIISHCLPLEIQQNAVAISEFVLKYLKPVYQHQRIVRKASVIEGIREGRLHGALMCELYPSTEDIRKKFVEFPPCHRHMDVTLEDLDENMRNWAKLVGNEWKQRRQLVATTEFKSPQLLETSYIRYMLSQGYLIRNMGYFICFKNIQCFASIVLKLVQLRKRADIDPSMFLLANLCKLLLK